MNVTNLLIYQNLLLTLQDQRVISCAASIMGRYSEVQSSIVYENIGKIVDDILANEMPNTTRIINIKEKLNYAREELEPYYMLTVILQNINELEIYFESIYRILGWNSRAKHFIVYLGDEDLDNIFQLSWTKFIIRLLVLDKYQNLYTYDPLRGNNCGSNIQKQFLFACRNKDYRMIDWVFSHYLTNFKGCKVRVLASPLVPYVIDVNAKKKPGFEIDSLRELSHIVNFTMEFTPHNYNYWGYKTANNKYTAMYKMFFDQKADIMLGMLAANGTFLYDFDASIVYATGALTFYLPALQKLDSWENILNIFDVPMWTAIVLSIISVFAVWVFQLKFSPTTDIFKDVAICAVYVWGILFGLSMRHPKTDGFRYIFMVWTVGAFIIKSTFECSLMSVLTAPSYDDEIDNLEKLVDSELPVGGYEYARELFQMEHKYKAIYDNWISCDLDASCVNRTVTTQNFAALNDVSQVRYLRKKYFVNADGTDKLYKMPSVSNFFVWILLLKGFPIRDRADQVMQRFVEYGLIRKWMNDVTNRARVETREIIALGLQHELFIFAVLGIGYVFQILVFTVEVLYFKWKQLKPKARRLVWTN